MFLAPTDWAMRARNLPKFGVTLIAGSSAASLSAWAASRIGSEGARTLQMYPSTSLQSSLLIFPDIVPEWGGRQGGDQRILTDIVISERWAVYRLGLSNGRPGSFRGRASLTLTFRPRIFVPPRASTTRTASPEGTSTKAVPSRMS